MGAPIIPKAMGNPQSYELPDRPVILLPERRIPVTPGPAHEAIVVSGKLTEIDKGSTAARWIIGFGAGRAIARGTFEIKDAGGATLARFESRKAYSGGAGIGGANLLDMDDLVRKLGEETANSLIRWSNGEPLEPPAKKSQ